MQQKLGGMKVGIIFHRYGPYHIARIDALNKVIETVGIELSGVTQEYQWDKVPGNNFERITLFADHDSRDASVSELKIKLYETLKKIKPDLMLINGWGDKGGLIALKWCVGNKVPTIVMTDETEDTQLRKHLKEFLKKKIIQLFDAALVAGKPQIDYVKKLGIAADLIEPGYDVVDNDYFIEVTKRVKAQPDSYRTKYQLPADFFVTSNRFIEKKNLFRLLEAYAKYVKAAGPDCWKMVMIGDGPLRLRIVNEITRLGLQNYVIMPGFLQYNVFPYYFALANAFIHASVSEQWGLVVNEAMASGLPVLVSEKCGCADDLVLNSGNGYSFDPYNTGELAEKMASVSRNKDFLFSMGKESEKIISRFTPALFTTSVKKLVEKLISKKSTAKSLLGRLLLNFVIYSSSVH